MKECFVIEPIGEHGSDIRRQSDQAFKYVILPVAQECGYKPIRALDLANPGIITNSIIQHAIDAPLVIANLTGHNPNVFYEVAIRHVTRKPIVHIIGRQDRIPFDIQSMRVTKVDLGDLDSVDLAKKEIKNQIKCIEDGKEEIDTPISITFGIEILRESKNPEQRIVADLVKAMAGRTEALANLEFDEKLAVLAGNRAKIKTGEEWYREIEAIRNNFRAASHLKNWVEVRRREQLIREYIIPIIEKAMEQERLLAEPIKLKALIEMLDVANEYNVESERLADLRRILEKTRAQAPLSTLGKA